MIDGRQVRAARAMLGWSREELLDASGISMSALLRMEGNMADSRSSTLNKVVKALSLAGIEFVTRDDGAIGVLLKAQIPPQPPHYLLKQTQPKSNKSCLESKNRWRLCK